MSPLRRRMIEDMTVRNFSAYTQRNYLFAVTRLARDTRMSPADLRPEQLRDYLNHLIERKISSPYFNVNVAALRFLYTVALERNWVLAKLPLQKRPRKLPTVLSVEEVGRFLATIPGLSVCPRSFSRRSEACQFVRRRAGSIPLCATYLF